MTSKHIISSKFYLKDNQVATTGDNYYTLIESIGRGGHSVVFSCENDDGEKFAIKFLNNYNNSSITRYERELSLYQLLSNDHLVRYVDNGTVSGFYSYTPQNSKKRVEKSHELKFIVLELAENGCLKDNLLKKISFEQYAPQIKGLSKALAVLHQKALHRDIKPENILVSGDKWLLSDFGLCKFIDGIDNNIQDLSQYENKIGPAFWMSPEASGRMYDLNNQNICKASDVYQLASIFWVIINKTFPAGILRKSDWKGPPALFEPLYYALHHDISMRPVDGAEFSRQIENAIES